MARQRTHNLRRRVAGGFFDPSPTNPLCRRGASRGTPGSGGRAYQKGCDVQRLHSLYFFAQRNWLGKRLGVEFFLSRHPMEQREFPLLARVGAPSTAPTQWIKYVKTYRQAVRLAWKFRTVEDMTRQELASRAKLYPQHVTDYLHEDDKQRRRDLPADAVARFEAVVGNSIVSQWLAAESHLTVLEEMQATRAVA